MQKSRRKNHVSSPGREAFDRLLAFGSRFTDRTRILGVGFDVKQETWELEFDNGCSITLRSDGTWKVARS